MLEIVGERLECGVVIAGAYRLERIVGEGGMGVVWAARELSSGRSVALKFLREGIETDPKQRERFVREARAAMAVIHPHVAKVEAVLETDVGAPFLVMELLEGMSFRELLTRRRTLPAIEAARLLSTVVDAVSAAHAAHIVHRDLKPENVFLVGGTDVRVLDFGIAKRLPQAERQESGAALTTAGALLGTPLYMAPEQIFGEEVDPSADVWALGIILYECIAGRRPTDAEGFGPIIKRITVDPIEPLERAAPSCPPGLARLVARMLTRDRAARPTLTEVKATLDQVSGAPASVPEDPAPRTHRIGPPPNVATPVHPVHPSPPANPPKRPEQGLLEKNAVLIAVGGALAFVLLIVTITVATGMAILDKEKFEAPPAPSAAASAPMMPKQRQQESAAALEAARAAQDARDGTTCLAKLDRHDDVTLVFRSTDVGGMYSDVRAKCLMLAKRCTEGRAVMRAFMEKKPSVRPSFEDELEQVVAEQCAGDDLTPREATLRAAFRLRSLPNPTAPQCDEWAKTLDALYPTIPSRGMFDKVHAELGKERASLRAQCHSRVKRN